MGEMSGWDEKNFVFVCLPSVLILYCVAKWDVAQEMERS